MLVLFRRAGRRPTRPACPSIRHTRPIVRPGTTFVMNSFSPLTTYSSPSQLGASCAGPSGRDRRTARSARRRDSRSPLASSGRNRCFCSALPKVRTGSTAPMQPCTRGQSGDRRVDHRHAWSGTERKLRNGAPLRRTPCRPAVPSSRLRPDRPAPAREILLLVVHAACPSCTVSLHDLDRIVHHRCDVGRRRRRHAAKQLDRKPAIPNGAMRRAVDGLVLRLETALDLSSALSIAPVRRASSSLLPPSFNAVSANDSTCGSSTGRGFSDGLAREVFEVMIRSFPRSQLSVGRQGRSGPNLRHLHHN